MEMKGALTLPRDEFWYDTAVALMKGKEEEILAEKGDLNILRGLFCQRDRRKPTGRPQLSKRKEGMTNE